MNILVVDDAIDILFIVTEHLKALGHIVYQATNGLEAIEHPDLHIMDIIFMDLQLPVMSGLVAAICIREKGIRIPIIACSTLVSENYISISTGCFSAYMTKPISFKILDKILERFKLTV